MKILETGFGQGLRFFAAWHAWRVDPARPALLHFVAIDACPVPPEALLQGAAQHPEWLPLAKELASQWSGLAPGMHRIALDNGRVLLTLCVGEVEAMLRQLDFDADAVVLWSPGESSLIKAVARLCRRGAVLTTHGALDALRKDLAQCGFVVAADEASAVYAPAWKNRRKDSVDKAVPATCMVVGAGLAGAAVAASLARRGWQVRVLDAGAEPAAGASGLPAGLLAPHLSPDDNLLSRLTRSGMRATLHGARALLQHGQDWCASGVLEQRPGVPAHWHPDAAWIKPAALVRAWLAQPGIAFTGGAHVERLVHSPQGWRALDAAGAELACADMVVIAAANGSASLAPPALALQPVRGQVSYGEPPAGAALAPTPVNGNGYFLPAIPVRGDTVWMCGSSFDRGDTDLAEKLEDHAANLERLRQLLPAVAARLAPAFEGGRVQAWTGVRCASQDRRPLLGELAPGLWISTAMGSRGLTFAALCAELLAARMHREPLPLSRKMADSLDVQRQKGM